MSRSQKVDAIIHNDVFPRRLQHILALAVLFVLPMILSRETFFGDKKFFAHDTMQWRAAAETIIQDRKTLDDEPLWAPNMFSGMPAYLISYKRVVPHLDDLAASVFQRVFPAAPLWILLGGCYVMFIILGARPFSAATGAVIIGFTTYIPIIIGAGHNTKVHAYSYIPWLVASYLYFRKGERPILAAALLALTMNLELRANHPQVTYYFGLLLSGWWAFDTWQKYREGALSGWLKTSFIVMIPGLLLGVAANIQPYWSIAEYSPYSIRGGSAAEGTAGTGLDVGYAFAWSQGWFELLTLLVPGIMGGSSATGYWGPKSVTSGPHYLGAIAFILAVAGLIRSSRKEKWFLLCGGVVAMAFSLGSHFLLLNQIMFEFFPLFNKFRTPEMWLIVTVFCGGGLAVFGLEALYDDVTSGASLKQMLISTGAGFAILLLLWIAARTTVSYQREDEVSIIAQQVAPQYGVSPTDRQLRAQIQQVITRQYLPQRKEVAYGDTTRALVLGLFFIAVILLASTQKIPAFWMGPVVFVLAAFDMTSVGRRYMALESLSPADMSHEQYFKRLKTPAVDWIVKNGKTDEGWPWRVLPLDENPFNNAVPSFFYPTVGGYSGAKMSIYQDVLNERFYSDSGLNLPLLQMLNVRYITLREAQEVPGFKVVYVSENRSKNGPNVVLENDKTLPKAWFVDKVFAVSSAREALDQLGAFDPAEAAFVMGTEAPVSIGRKENATVKVTEYGPRAISLQTSNGVAGFLVLSEIYYPAGWKAYVDDVETPIYQTNYLLRGIEVPAGAHTIRFRFNPASHEKSTKISWAMNLSILLLLAVGIGLGFRKAA